MGKILCFIYDRMADFELTLAYCLIGLYGEKEIVTISYEKNPVKGAVGVEFLPKATIREALAFEDVEGLIIPGGWNDEHRPELTELIRKLNDEGKLLAAICAGPQYLARAGVLGGHSYTTTLTEDVMKEKGVPDPFPRDTYVKQNVVRDKNIVTAVGNAFVDFAVEICDWFKIMKNPEEKEEIARVYKGLDYENV